MFNYFKFNIMKNCNEKVATKNAEKIMNDILDMVMGNEKNGVCSICGKSYKDYGHNAKPYDMGRCCSECNSKYVIPTRIKLVNILGYCPVWKDMNVTPNLKEMFN